MKFGTLRTHIFVFLFILNGAIFKLTSADDVPADIKDLFHGFGNNSDVQTRKSKDISIDNNMNYAEGSSHNVNKLNTTSSKGSDFPPLLPKDDHSSKNNLSLTNSNSTDTTKEGKTSDTKNTATSLHIKLKERPDLDLIGLKDGMPSVNHVNGSSSIKPRKGAPRIDDIPLKSNKGDVPSRIVPRKGVDINNEYDNSLPLTNSCFVTSKNECFNVSQFHHSNCSCCDQTNNSGEVVSPKYSVNCSMCKLIDDILHDVQQSCNEICCKTVLSFNVNQMLNSFSSEDISNISKNITKHKPAITKVPFDVEAVSVSPFQSNSKTVVIPIVVSAILLPLVGTLIFFVWKKTRDFWDKRHYRRMDFLIDGIYND